MLRSSQFCRRQINLCEVLGGCSRVHHTPCTCARVSITLFLQKSTFHFLNLSPDLLSIRASNDPKRPRKGNNQLYRADVCIIVVNLKHVSRCLEKSRMAKMAREWLDGIDPVISPQRACAKTVVKYK